MRWRAAAGGDEVEFGARYARVRGGIVAKPEPPCGSPDEAGGHQDDEGRFPAERVDEEREQGHGDGGAEPRGGKVDALDEAALAQRNPGEDGARHAGKRAGLAVLMGGAAWLFLVHSEGLAVGSLIMVAVACIATDFPQQFH